jgi:hypothetical protein
MGPIHGEKVSGSKLSDKVLFIFDHLMTNQKKKCGRLGTSKMPSRMLGLLARNGRQDEDGGAPD